MRSKKAQPRSSQYFKSVQKQFEVWRKTRTRRSPIPEHLWKSAVSLAQDNSLYTVSKALHLNYAALKQRVHAASACDRSSKADRPKFVEIEGPTSSFSESPVLEMARPDGTKLKLHLQGLCTKDLFNLARSFWSQES
jgi:hypothetical protein